MDNIEDRNNAIRCVSKYYFINVDKNYQILENSDETAYLLYVKTNQDINEVIKCARLLCREYKIVLLSDSNSEYICVVIYINIDEKDSFEHTLNWIKKNHPDCSITCINDMTNDLKIIAKRVANTQFQAKKLMLYGERLD